MSDTHGSKKAIFYALGANLGIALSKLFAAIFTGSGSMLAEAVHSFADCGNQGLLFLGLYRARRPVSRDHPLGYGKAIFFWSFIVALMLFSLGGLFSVYEGLHKIAILQAAAAGEGDLSHPWVAIAILLVAVFLEGLSLMGALRESHAARAGKNIWRWFRTSRQSELIVVVGEDVAALLGLVIALVAILMAIITGKAIFDALGSIAIGLLLIAVAIAVSIEVKSLLIGESASPEMEEAIRCFLIRQEGVRQLLHLITLQIGAEVMVAVKAEMSEQPSVTVLVETINSIERNLKREFPEIRWSFFEPDIRD